MNTSKEMKNVNTISFELHTSFTPFVDVGLYETILSLDTDNESYEIDDLVNEGKCTEEQGVTFKENITTDLDGYKKRLAKEATVYINENLDTSDIPFKISELKDASIWSPKEYNFQTDQLDYTIEVESNFMEHIENELNENRVEFVKYMNKYYGSRDGFNSFAPIPNSYDTVTEYMNEIKEGEKEYYLFSMYLMYMLDKNDCTLDQSDFEMEMCENCPQYEFVTIPSEASDLID